jgi:hypothetical protein
MSPTRPDAPPAAKPIEVSAELKSLMRRLKLGQLLDTLPERLALARSNRLPHHDFLEMLLADEVTRRDRSSAAPRPPIWIRGCSCRPGTTPPPSASTNNCGPS